MNQKLAAGCARLLPARWGEVRLHGRPLVLRTASCVDRHGAACLSRLAERLTPILWLQTKEEEDSAETEAPNTQFSFTGSPLMLDSTTTLRTVYGDLKCLPDAEYALWWKAGLCHVAPLLILLDGVQWRVIASSNATTPDDDSTHPEMILADDTEPIFHFYLEAHRSGGQLLEEVHKATMRGQDDLNAHREFLFKVFHLLRIPPTLSHDLSKTKLVNFALGRCFSSDDLKLLQDKTSFADCMALVKRLHLEVENHHPEHGARPTLEVLDMYLDRVARGVQKTHGWDNKAWCIPEKFAPPGYKEDFANLQAQYGHVQLVDPGDLDLPNQLPGAQINVKWEDLGTIHT